MGAPFHYHLFGLTLRSTIELPELIPAQGNGDCDVEITRGKVAGAQDEGFGVTETGAMLTIPGVARYEVSGGSQILVDAALGAGDANVRLYLLGSVMGALLHQRGMLPLHANAIEIDGLAVAFMGPSGAGKSTLAAAFHDRGFAVLADDICVIGAAQGKVMAYPGVPRLRLWEEALHASGRASEPYQLSYAGDEDYRKFDIPVEGRIEGLPLAGLFLLAKGDRLSFRPLGGAEAAAAVFGNTYRGALVETAGDPLGHWSASMALLTSMPVIEVQRAWDLTEIPGNIDPIVEYVRPRLQCPSRH
ncbi:MAG TPA: hypothetical protein VNA29_00835 [Sphingomicrobium sp.]|nr:hypothetical protein [Sphingomicrobium sp.]